VTDTVTDLVGSAFGPLHLDLPQQIRDISDPFGLRLGTVEVSSTSQLIVNVGGGQVVNPGCLFGWQPAVGATVVLARQDSTWLVLGTVQAPGAGGMFGLVGKAVSTAGTICLNTTTTFLTYDTILDDTAGGWDFTVSADSYTVQYDGRYLVNAGAGLPAGTGQRTHQMRRNGAAFEGSTTIWQATAAGQYGGLTQVVLSDFRRGDTIAQTLNQNSGGSLTTLTADAQRQFLQVIRIGDLG